MSVKNLTTQIFSSFAYVPKIKFRKGSANQAKLTPQTIKPTIPQINTNSNIQRKSTTGKGIVIPSIKSPKLSKV